MGGMTSEEGGCDVADCGLSTTPAMFMVSCKAGDYIVCSASVSYKTPALHGYASLVLVGGGQAASLGQWTHTVAANS